VRKQKNAAASMGKSVLAALFAIIALMHLGCSVNVPAPTESYVIYANNHGSDLTLAHLTQGHIQYRAYCGGCHGLRAPVRFAPEEWPDLLKDMVERAEVPVAQIPPIRDYLRTASGYLRDSVANAKSNP
jgi:mono/diheme cytochrome c family protein